MWQKISQSDAKNPNKHLPRCNRGKSVTKFKVDHANRARFEVKRRAVLLIDVKKKTNILPSRHGDFTKHTEVTVIARFSAAALVKFYNILVRLKDY